MPKPQTVQHILRVIVKNKRIEKYSKKTKQLSTAGCFLILRIEKHRLVKNKRNDATIAIEDSLIKKFVINGSNRRVNDFCLESPVKPIVKVVFCKTNSAFKNLIYFFLKYDLIFAMIFLKKN